MTPIRVTELENERFENSYLVSRQRALVVSRCTCVSCQYIFIELLASVNTEHQNRSAISCFQISLLTVKQEISSEGSGIVSFEPAWRADSFAPIESSKCGLSWEQSRFKKWKYWKISAGLIFRSFLQKSRCPRRIGLNQDYPVIAEVKSYMSTKKTSLKSPKRKTSTN